MPVKTVGYKLKPRHYSFIQHYTTIGSPTYSNGSESVRLSGFETRNPSRTAVNLLKNPQIVQEISRITEEKARSFDWTYNEWLKKGTDCFDELPSTNANKVRFWEIIGKAKEYITDSKITNNNLYVLNGDDIEAIRKKIGAQSQINSNVKELNINSNNNSEAEVIEVEAKSTGG